MRAVLECTSRRVVGSAAPLHCCAARKGQHRAQHFDHITRQVSWGCRGDRMADLDVARLQAELRELEGQRREVCMFGRAIGRARAAETARAAASPSASPTGRQTKSRCSVVRSSCMRGGRCSPCQAGRCRRRHCRRRVSLGIGTLAHDFSALTLLRVTLQVNERLRQTAPVRGPPPRGPPGPPGPWDRPRRPHVSIIGLLLCSSTFGAPQNLWSMVLYLTCPPCPWVLLQDAPPPYRGPPGLDPRGQHDYRDEGPPPARRPGLSSVVAPVEGSEGGDRSSERYSYGDERSEGGRSEGSRKRPAPGGALLEENVDVKRRNKRLFGAILGTLQRFRWVGRRLASRAVAGV